MHSLHNTLAVLMLRLALTTSVDLDVTTIYRFQRIASPEVNGNFSEIGECNLNVPDGCNWAVNGWSMKTDAVGNNFLELREEDVASLESEIVSVPNQAICILIGYYLQFNTDSVLHVKIKFNNGSEQSIGNITPYTDEQELPWRRRIFFQDIDSNTNNFKMKITAKKGSSERVGISQIRVCNNEDKIGLSTIINRENSVEVHSRTSARGFPIAFEDGEILDSNDVNIQPCTSTNGCRWKRINFSLVDDTTPFSFVEDAAIEWETELKKFNAETSFTFHSATHEVVGLLKLYLFESVGQINKDNQYLIEIIDFKLIKFYKCEQIDEDYYHGRRWYDHHEYYARSTSDQECLLKHSVEINKGYYKSQPTYKFKLEKHDNNISLSVSSEENKPYRLFWSDTVNKHINYYAVSKDSSAEGHLTIHIPGVQKSFSLDAAEGYLESADFVPDHGEVCVSVVYQAVNASVTVQVVHLDGEGMVLPEIQTTDLDAQITGWKSGIFSGEFASEKLHKLIKVRVSGFVTTEQTVTQESGRPTLKLQYLAGCNNNEGLKEDVHIVSPEALVNEINLEEFHVPIIGKQHSVPQNKNCVNGGLFSSKRNSCVCPAGIMGANCETGCGEDRYGLMCDGRCSKTRKGCMEMLLCRPELGCSCGTGIKGLLCDTPCSQGEYGVECKQECGNCAHGVCDRYTGVCSSGCKEGFRSPMCQNRYKYLTESPTLKDTGLYTTEISFDLDWVIGEGESRFYQVHIKNEDIEMSHWIELEPALLPDISTVDRNITNLTPDTKYEVRVILLDADGNSYQGLDVPVASYHTLCSIPTHISYNLTADIVKKDEFQVSWQYEAENSTWCKFTQFEVYVKLDWKWHLYYSGVEKMAIFSDMLPGETYAVKVRTTTRKGPGPFSEPLIISTKDEAPDGVRELKIVSKTHDQLEVKWQEPFTSRGKIQSYRILYKCVRLLSCSQVTCSHSGDVEVVKPYILLRNLQPHTQYSISVSAKAAVYGTSMVIYGTTDMTLPHIAANSSTTPVLSRSNTSLTIQWKPPENCTFLNGYPSGYIYELYAANMHRPIQEGQTKDFSVTLTALNPLTLYTFKVFVNTMGGKNLDYPLTITAYTRATVPSKVQQLTVYKTGRHVIGLRWDKPEETYGDIKSFTISYKSKYHKAMSAVIKPTLCVAWPHLFCHSINSVRPDTEYIITLQAQNNHVAEDGETAEVRATTKENAPLAPSYIKAISQMETNITIEWGLPRMLNGVLRSFLVNIEETDSFNSSECCQYFPIQEIPVRYEQASYQMQFKRLKPASTYAVSVTAKTNSMGPAVSVTTHTRPPVPSMEATCQLVNGTELSTNPTVIIHPISEQKELVVGYLLLVIPESSSGSVAEFYDDWIAQELMKKINRTFYVAEELSQENLEEHPEVVLGTGSEIRYGTWSQLQDPILEDGQQYRFGLVVILDYCGVLNIGYTQTGSYSYNIGLYNI